MDVILIDSDLSDGLRIRLCRIARGLRQFELAAEAHTTPAIVSMAERNVPVPPKPLARIRAALGLGGGE